MREIKKLELIGYVQLYMKLWRVDKPDVAFYFKMDTDFTVPLDEETVNYPPLACAEVGASCLNRVTYYARL